MVSGVVEFEGDMNSSIIWVEDGGGGRRVRSTRLKYDGVMIFNFF